MGWLGRGLDHGAGMETTVTMTIVPATSTDIPASNFPIPISEKSQLQFPQ